MYDDFIDPAVGAYFARMAGTPALAMYRRWKAGETLHVRTIPLTPGEVPVEFEIQPVHGFFGSSLVVGATVVVDGKPVPGNIGKLFAASDFLDWCTSLELVEE